MEEFSLSQFLDKGSNFSFLEKRIDREGERATFGFCTFLSLPWNDFSLWKPRFYWPLAVSVMVWRHYRILMRMCTHFMGDKRKEGDTFSTPFSARALFYKGDTLFPTRLYHFPLSFFCPRGASQTSRIIELFSAKSPFIRVEGNGRRSKLHDTPQSNTFHRLLHLLRP